jgi:glyceraldehyde 3-phosphate dehydrogenase
VAINDLGDPKIQAHLLKHDSVHGTLSQNISSQESSILIDDKKIAYFQEKDPSSLPWRSLGIDLVLECTGIFTNKIDAAKHLNSGAKK